MCFMFVLILRHLWCGVCVNVCGVVCVVVCCLFLKSGCGLLWCDVV